MLRNGPGVWHHCMIKNDLEATVADVVANLPKWLRNDLSSAEEITRERAEETLVAKICSGLKGAGNAASE